ncbi:hypothetical protein [Gluconobacter oxydans]|uniref:hypothetical protein n=1 Tax=Gluconobacter oxydans TaxID=442 RepID=UPI0026490E7D|nr:hypothetical protein [Gluconobacter oxydans]WKE49664.1 hypothetical protein NUJ38_14140 [Gluconobacter oxydans]
MTDQIQTPDPAPETDLSDREILLSRLDEQDEEIRFINEKLSILIELLTPSEKGDGPTLDDILARLVELLRDQEPVIKRIDHTTARNNDLLEGRIVLPKAGGHPRS